MVKDKADNTNNRFGVGSEINRRPDRRPVPVLGLPAEGHPDHAAAQARPARTGRTTCRSSAMRIWRPRARPRSGSSTTTVRSGGQAILGIPFVRRLKLARGEETVKVWPFETGFKALTEADLAGVEVVLAEVYPRC